MSKPRVLVVEDDTDIADVLRRSLRIEGYDVKVSGDGNDALGEASVFEPDAVVLDLGLPGLDGVEVSRGDRRIELTAREFELLEYLRRNERLVISCERLVDDVWGYAPLAAIN